MGSSTVEAQKLANEANVKMNQATNLANLSIAKDTNESNYQIAQEANDLNYRMFNEQNQWNLEQWQRENEYNSPAAQMERMMQAGINPLWGFGNVDPGNAQQLTSASSQPAAVADQVTPRMEPARVSPEYDPDVSAKIGNILAAGQNVVNGAQGFYKLALEAQDVETRRSAQESNAALQRAEAMFKKSQTEGQHIFNNLNTRTFETQVQSKVADYQRTLKQIASYDKDDEYKDSMIKNNQATYDQIQAMTNYIGKQSDALLESIKQRWQEIAIASQNADTNEFSARSDSYYHGESLKLDDKKYQLAVKEAESRFNNMDNQTILNYINSSKGYFQKIVGVFQRGTYGIPGLQLEVKGRDFLGELDAAGIVLHERMVKDPTESNVKSYQEYLDTLNSINKSSQQAPAVPYTFTPQTYSVLNPSESWLSN